MGLREIIAEGDRIVTAHLGDCHGFVPLRPERTVQHMLADWSLDDDELDELMRDDPAALDVIDY